MRMEGHSYTVRGPKTMKRSKYNKSTGMCILLTTVRFKPQPWRWIQKEDHLYLYQTRSQWISSGRSIFHFWGCTHDKLKKVCTLKTENQMRLSSPRKMKTDGKNIWTKSGKCRDKTSQHPSIRKDIFLKKNTDNIKKNDTETVMSCIGLFTNPNGASFWPIIKSSAVIKQGKLFDERGLSGLNSPPKKKGRILWKWVRLT